MACKERGQVYEHAERGARKGFSMVELSAGSKRCLRTSPERDEFVEEEVGEARGVVPDYAALLQKVGGDVAEAHALEFSERRLNDFGSLRLVAAQHLSGDWAAIDYSAIE